MKNKNRIWEIDFLRGFAILAMIFDHFMFDLAQVFNFNNDLAKHLKSFAEFYLSFTPREIIQDVFVAIFVALSGISSSFSRNNLLRGFKLLAVSLVLTLVTYILQIKLEGYFIILFGILHMLAVSIILYAFLQRFGNILIGVIGVLMIFAGLLITYFNVTSTHNLFMSFGIYNDEFFSADYYPIFPWCGVFFIGAVIGKIFYKEKLSLLPALNECSWHRPIQFIGRHSLGIYLVHQPILWGLIALFTFIFGYKFYF